MINNIEIFYILPKHDYFSNGYRGRVTHALGVANGLDENNISVTIFSNQDVVLFRKDLNKNIRLFPFRASKYFNNVLLNFIWQIKLFNKVKVSIKEQRPKVVICRYAVSNVFFNLLLSLYLRNCCTGILEINSLAYHQYYRLPLGIRKLIMWLEVKQLNRFRFLYVISKKIETDLHNNKCKSEIIVIPNALGGLRPKLKKGKISDNIIRIIFFGKFQPYYDYKTVISVFKKIKIEFKNVELHFWGDGHQFTNAVHLTDNFIGIHFHGKYNRDDLNKLFNLKNDIFILPIKANHIGEIVSPIKMFEYMSFGLPIIVANIGQAEELFRDRINGFCYKPDSIDSLYDTISFCISNPEIRIRAGKQIKKELLTQHTWAKRMLKLLNYVN
ncbi:glycosyltransferase [Candidatus Neomarinimicrobiota bacterium]